MSHPILPLTKAFAGQSDLDALQQEISWLGPEVLSGQHPARAWEYGLAVRALQTWNTDPGHPWPRRILDVGGSGSRFGQTLGDKLGAGWEVELVDPLETYPLELRVLAPAQVILAISVLEHVPDPIAFWLALGANLAPGGLAFLTMDGWDQPQGTPDTAHFHWMRERIHSTAEWRWWGDHRWDALGLLIWGGVDWTYHGDQVYTPEPGGYSFLSLCLRKS